MKSFMVSPRSYDELWRSSWGELQRIGPVHRHVTQLVLSTVASLPVRTVVDIGCGSGDNLAALAAQNRYELVGTDISEEALKLARQRVPSARLMRLDIEQHALPESFDVVMSMQVIEHLADDVAALAHMATMARSYVFISTLEGRMRPSELAIGHVRNYSRTELRRKVEQVGLRVVKMWGWGFPWYSPFYRTVSEWLPGGPPIRPTNAVSRFAAVALYQLYRLNWPGRGDVLMVLAQPAHAASA